jgi:hypothetical protein
MVKRRRRWPRYVALFFIACVLLVIFAPSLVLRTPARGWLLRNVLPEHADYLQVKSISAGWQTPIEVRGVRYSSASVEFVADSVRCDRSLLDLLRDANNLGRIEVKSPEVSFSIEPASAVKHGSSPASSSRRNSVATRKRPAIVVDFHVTDGAVYVVNSERGRTCLASDVDAELNSTPGSERASFRMMSRTGDPKATAYLSASGTLNWPCESVRTGLIESHVDLVGVDADVVEHLLGAAGLARRSAGQREGNVTNHFSGRISGSAEFRAAKRNSVEVRANFEVREFCVAEPSSGLELREPIISISAVARLADDVLHLDSGRIAADGLIFDAAGIVTHLAQESHADLHGSLLCDWQKLTARLRQVFPDEIRITGKERRPWRLVGALRGDSLGEMAEKLELDAELYVESLNVCNFDLGPTELAAHWNEGAVRFEPIVCAFQHGEVRVQPSIRFSEGVPILQVHEGRVIDHVALDPKLCEWILRYVDPLATISRNLQGHLSLEIDELEIPLTCDGLDRGSIVGRLVLEDVQFAPEESLREILATAGVTFRGESVRTTQNIEFRVADGRVQHSGLAVPIGNESITLDGWVGLDQTINIRISVPVTEEMLGKDKRLYRLLRGQRIELPVTGTLEHPKVSEEALARNIQRLVQSALRDNLGDDPLRGLLRRAIK